MTMSRTLVALGFVVALSAAPALAQTAQEPPSITTQGQAAIRLAPDVAWVTVLAEARAGKPGEAQRKAADAMTSVQAALKALALAPDAIKTLSYSLQPEMEWVNGTSRVKGYVARNTIEVRTDDIEKLGAVIDAAGASGAASVSGMRFDVKNRMSVEREALTLAGRDAMARARAIAGGIGATLGSVIRVHDERMYSPVPQQRQMVDMMSASKAAGPPPTPIEAGEIEIRAQMTVVFAIVK
jgi:uncharacterized protein YggE